jgi:hypothetical protein
VLACASLNLVRADQRYYWQASAVDGSAELLTLFCHECEDAGNSGRDIPLVSVLRDTLGTTEPQDERISYVWLLTYSQPNFAKRVLSAVPFFYWKIGDGSEKVGRHDLKPLMNLSLPQRSVVSSTMRNVVQWTVLDPVSMPVRASSRSYQSNNLDHERLHLEEAESYLQSAPASNDETGLNQKELNTVIARLELRKSMLGDFVSAGRAPEFGEEANLEQERIRARNWELLRQCADKTGLLFEPINLAGANNQYAIVWFPVDRSAPPEGTRLEPIWKLLNLKDPYPQREDILTEPRYTRTLNGQTEQMIPLGVYSLTYPKMPLLMIDFRDGTHLKRHELTQRAVNEITSGVIGISHFTNWYYYIGADLYDFYASRRGTAMNQQERLTSYSKFRVALALDRTLDPSLRTAMQQRVNSFSVNPLETAPSKELLAAVQRYDLLQEAARSEDSPLLHRLEKDRRNELARFEANKSEQARDGIFHYATFGLYTPRAKGDDFLERLDRCRRVDYNLTFLDGLEAAGTQPEVAYDPVRIQRAVSQLTALLPEIDSRATRQHAEQTLEKLQGLSSDSQLKAQCLTALDFLHGTATASGIREGSGTPETLR